MAPTKVTNVLIKNKFQGKFNIINLRRQVMINIPDCYYEYGNDEEEPKVAFECS
ncbi:TPA: hypothetical protein ACY4RZ_001855 [Clostridium perfringens]